MALEKDFSHSWWFVSQNRANNCSQSLWLNSTLSELDSKTQQMLKLIEEDADSFAKRAEMYYKKRPQLVSMIEEFYRNYRSLAEQYDQLKQGCGVRRSFSFGLSCLDKSWSHIMSNSESDEAPKYSLDSSDSEESEIIDREQEENDAESEPQELPDTKTNTDFLKLKCELDKLKEENESLKAEIASKDEEKREVIRQLAISMDILREENACLRTFMKDTKKKGGMSQFKKLTGNMFSGKFFGRQSK